MQRIMSHRTVVRLTRVAEGVPVRPWTDAQDELLWTRVGAASWQAEWMAIVVRLSAHLPGACRTRRAQAKVGSWTPVEGWPLLHVVGDGGLDWEGVVTTVDPLIRQLATAVGPPQTAISCWSRWVLVGSSRVVPGPSFWGRPDPTRTRTTKSHPPRRPRPRRRDRDRLSWDGRFPHCPFRL
jgi:hypothetical protein